MTDTVSANGAEIPVIGLGTWQLRGEVATRCVAAALDIGYRHIDTATMYDNEAAVGEGIRGHSVPREEVFVTTKVWPTDAAEGALQRSAEASLGRLGLDRIDLLLIHWPNREVSIAEQVGALCDAKRRGYARHVGVANFPPGMLRQALAAATEPLVCNQVEHHPLLDQTRLLEACRAAGMALVSYSPLGKGTLVSDPVIGEIAAAKERTPAQVILRWHLQQPMNAAIPRSSKPARLAENFAVFDFALTPAEMARISGLARPDGRMVRLGGAEPDWNA
ncbi:aldo/keto reductase [Propylenella binzhouense]|uniref:Aldo/keto reductase n=1 Tax=Propylenella binzhouense TaxID=2555902 RepID=A0A964T6M4_9HYPH|nr:aldo/keto reductase [Propylenella binzhouense]MYZ49516.1 aldo/keto reductase [Propylenella binzhouense]